MVVKKDRYQYCFDHFVVKDGTREVQLEIYESDTKLGGRYNPAFYREIIKPPDPLEITDE